MTRCIVIINRSIIAWCLRSQKIVTLSVTEAEYSEITEVSCEILFFRIISLFVVVFVELSITVHIDDVGSDNIIYICIIINIRVSEDTALKCIL